jgi:hypothetical protein
MAEETPESPEVTADEQADLDVAASAPPRKRSRFWKWVFILAGIVIVVPAILFAIWTWIALSWTYSEGDRAGYVQKFSKKGWLCKTWEGELSMVNIPGAAQERWEFSVRDDSIAEVIKRNMGDRVSLTYQEKRGIPSSCFGETNYFVTGVRRVQ